MSSTTATLPKLVPFSDLPMGARFKYPGSDSVWTVIDKYREKVDEPMSGTIAEWREDMLTLGLWTGQSICSHTPGVGCPEMVIPVN